MSARARQGEATHLTRLVPSTCVASISSASSPSLVMTVSSVVLSLPVLICVICHEPWEKIQHED